MENMILVKDVLESANIDTSDEQLELIIRLLSAHREQIEDRRRFEIEKKVKENIQKKMQEEIATLKDSLFFDELTGCYTRKWLSEEFLHGRNSFRGDGFIVMVDLDNFKMINDTYGHNVGDDALKFVSNQLMELQISKKNNVVRFGGDEFFLIINELNGCKLADVDEQIQKLQKKVLEKHFVADGGYMIKVGFSFGVAQFSRGYEFNSIVEIADKNMYKNKQTKNERDR